MLRGVMTAALGAALLAAPVAPHLYGEPWSDGDCVVEWCNPATPPGGAGDGIAQGLARAARAAELGAGRDCVTPAEWVARRPRPGLPTTMVVATGDRVERTAWRLPAPAGWWVLLVCAR